MLVVLVIFHKQYFFEMFSSHLSHSFQLTLADILQVEKQIFTVPFHTRLFAFFQLPVLYFTEAIKAEKQHKILKILSNSPCIAFVNFRCCCSFSNSEQCNSLFFLNIISVLYCKYPFKNCSLGKKYLQFRLHCYLDKLVIKFASYCLSKIKLKDPLILAVKEVYKKSNKPKKFFYICSKSLNFIGSVCLQWSCIWDRISFRQLAIC